MDEKATMLSRALGALRDLIFREPVLRGWSRGDLGKLGFPVSLGGLALALELGAAVYEADAEALTVRWRLFFDRVEVVDLPGVENRYVLFTHRRSRRQYISIRGTANVANILLDLKFLKKIDPLLGIDTHQGFSAAAIAVYRDVAPKLRRGYQVHVVGHSLGGAEAELLGMMLSSAGWKVRRVVAIAPPKVTDAAGWAKYASLPVVRVAAPFDPVPFLPPKSLVYATDPYLQGGNLLMLLDGEFAATMDPGFYDDIGSALKGTWASGKRFDVPDHQMANYTARMEAKSRGMRMVDNADWLEHATPVESETNVWEMLVGMVRASRAGQKAPARPEDGSGEEREGESGSQRAGASGEMKTRRSGLPDRDTSGAQDSPDTPGASGAPRTGEPGSPRAAMSGDARTGGSGTLRTAGRNPRLRRRGGRPADHPSDRPSDRPADGPTSSA